MVAVGLFACCAWLVVLFGSELMIMMPTAEHRLASATLIVAAIVAVTLHAGAPMAIIVLTFLLFGYGAQFLPGAFSSAPVSLGSYLVYMLFGGVCFLSRLSSLACPSKVMLLGLVFISGAVGANALLF